MSDWTWYQYTEKDNMHKISATVAAATEDRKKNNTNPIKNNNSFPPSLWKINFDSPSSNTKATFLSLSFHAVCLVTVK